MCGLLVLEKTFILKMNSGIIEMFKEVMKTINPGDEEQFRNLIRKIQSESSASIIPRARDNVESYTPTLYINTTPCQFPFSKTTSAIEYINRIDESLYCPMGEPGVHHLTLIVTNNSLIDGRQWTNRLVDRTKKGRNTAILSSDKKKARFTKFDDFLAHLRSIKDSRDLIDTLVMCNNKVRATDISKIIDELLNEPTRHLKNAGIHKFKITIMFDEADKPENINNAKEFLKNSNNEYGDIIESIHLLTATPYKNFWNTLHSLDINKLVNLRNVLEVPPVDKSIEEYRRIKDHNIIHVKSNEDEGYFIIDVYEKYVYKERRNGSIRLFAPAGRYCKTHDEVKEYFKEQGFIVVIINGREKSIYLPDGVISIDDFNDEYLQIDGEVDMKDTLVELDKLYKDYNIVITGFTCIERGVTFQTTGFNFTDMIVPPIKNIATSIQIIGRANGGKQYVEKHNIFIQKEDYDVIIERIERTIAFMKTNPEVVDETNFGDKTANEKDIDRWTIPESIDLEKDDFEYITEKRGNKFYEDRVIDMINKYNIDIEGYTKALWSIPKSENSYKKTIENLKKACQNNKKWCILHSKNKRENKKFYSLYFDYKTYKVIIMKYNGDV